MSTSDPHSSASTSGEGTSKSAFVFKKYSIQRRSDLSTLKFHPQKCAMPTSRISKIKAPSATFASRKQFFVGTAVPDPQMLVTWNLFALTTTGDKGAPPLPLEQRPSSRIAFPEYLEPDPFPNRIFPSSAHTPFSPNVERGVTSSLCPPFREEKPEGGPVSSMRKSAVEMPRQKRTASVSLEMLQHYDPVRDTHMISVVKIADVNDTFCHCLGFKRKLDLIGANILKFIPSSVHAQWQLLIEHALNFPDSTATTGCRRPPLCSDMMFVCKDGTHLLTGTRLHILMRSSQSEEEIQVEGGRMIVTALLELVTDRPGLQTQHQRSPPPQQQQQQQQQQVMT